MHTLQTVLAQHPIGPPRATNTCRSLPDRTALPSPTGRGACCPGDRSRHGPPTRRPRAFIWGPREGPEPCRRCPGWLPCTPGVSWGQAQGPHRAPPRPQHKDRDPGAPLSDPVVGQAAQTGTGSAPTPPSPASGACPLKAAVPLRVVGRLPQTRSESTHISRRVAGACPRGRGVAQTAPQSDGA